MNSEVSQAREEAREAGRELVDKTLKTSHEILKHRDYMGVERINADSLALQKVEKIISRNGRTINDLDNQITARNAHLRPFVDLGALRHRKGAYEIVHTKGLNSDDSQLFRSHISAANDYIKEARSKISGLVSENNQLQELKESLKNSSESGPKDLIPQTLVQDPLYDEKASKNISGQIESNQKGGAIKGKHKTDKNPLKGTGLDATDSPFGPVENPLSPQAALEQGRRSGMKSRNGNAETKRSGKGR